MQTYKVFKIKNDIPSGLWDRVKAYCIIHKKRLAEFLTEALEYYLKIKEEEAKQKGE